MLEQIESLIANIRHVGDAVAHDLRSPLTSINWGGEPNQAALIRRLNGLLAAHPAFHGAGELLLVNRLIARLEHPGRDNQMATI